MSLKFSLPTIFSVIFLLQFNHFVSAQNGTSNSAAHTKINQTNQSVSLVDPNEPQLEDGKTIAEGKKMKEDYLVWKMYSIEESKSEALPVNYDSVYTSFILKRVEMFHEKPRSKFSKFYVIPNQLLPKMLALDSNVSRMIVPADKHFSLIVVGSEVLSAQLSNQLQKIQQADNKYKLSTQSFVSDIMPPIILNEESKNISGYANAVNLFFILNPEYIYYCSKGFVNLLINKQYSKLYALQKSTSNVISLNEHKSE